MNKPFSRLDRLPQPLVLSKKPPVTSLNNSQKPYRLKVQDNANLKSSFILSDMKQELNLIRDDVQKLLVTPNQHPSLLPTLIPQTLTQTLKDELLQAKLLQQRLHKQLKKSKTDALRLIEQSREESNKKQQKLRREYKEERQELKNRIQRLNETIEDLRGKGSGRDKQVQEMERRLEESESEGLLAKRKYQSSLGEFKKLEERFIKDQKGGLESVQRRLYEVERVNVDLKMENVSLGNEKERMEKRVERVEKREQELKERNQELQEKLRVGVRDVETTREIEELKNTISELQSENAFLTMNLETKKVQYEQLMRKVEDLNARVEEDKEIHKQRLEIVELELRLGEEVEKNTLLINHIEYLKQILEQKESYIQALEDQTPALTSSNLINQLQSRCQALTEQKNKLIRDHQRTINSLQNSQRSFLLNQSMISPTSPRRPTNFDQILKEQIRQNDSLKVSLKQRGEEILGLKQMVSELERRADTMKNQFEVERLKLQNQSKSASKNIEYGYESMKQELEILKRREATLQQKLEMKVDELKKKDEFIQKHLIGKIGKDKDQSETRYLAEQLERFVASKVTDSSFMFDVSRIDSPRMYKHPELLKSSKIGESMLKETQMNH